MKSLAKGKILLMPTFAPSTCLDRGHNLKNAKRLANSLGTVNY